MDLQQKIELAQKIYKREDVTSKRIEDIGADLFWVAKTRGPGSLIIGDDGEYLLRPSGYAPEKVVQAFKNGERSK